MISGGAQEARAGCWTSNLGWPLARQAPYYWALSSAHFCGSKTPNVWYLVKARTLVSQRESKERERKMEEVSGRQQQREEKAEVLGPQ